MIARAAVVFLMLATLIGCDSEAHRARQCLSADGRPVYAAEPPYRLTACVFEGPAR